VEKVSPKPHIFGFQRAFIFRGLTGEVAEYREESFQVRCYKIVVMQRPENA
jgi:ribosomal protein L21E